MDESRTNSQKRSANDPVGDQVERPGCSVGKGGTGTLNIIDWCRDNGNQEPEWRVDVNSVVLVFYPVPVRPESQLEPQPELQPELQPESFRGKVIQLLANEALSKSEISRKLGQKAISGHLNKVLKSLLDEGVVAYTVPGKPQSRLQKYRLTEKGGKLLHTKKQRY